MSGIRGRDTKPEMMLRRMLHRQGFRYRLHARNVPGKPDLVFPKYRAAILAHGCFWHGHDCHLFRWPSSRVDFWRDKIARNRERDAAVLQKLDSTGWRVLTVWECALKGRNRLPPEEVARRCVRWLKSGSASATIEGTRH